ncbi:hypothetical protein [Clostridium polynesiense]|uniref:hypothetical protein n=1 Tax=Clostridium polynesiense TaxID=1325933 RepID=UPI00058C1D84|nr:hypothetical protein [Clostridium polynesiense]
MKSSGKYFFMTMVTVIFGILITYFIWYSNLEEYTWENNKVTCGKITYRDAGEEGKKYAENSYRINKIIGRFKGDKFLGSKSFVVKLKNTSEKEAVLIKRSMCESIYIAE